MSYRAGHYDNDDLMNGKHHMSGDTCPHTVSAPTSDESPVLEIPTPLSLSASNQFAAWIKDNPFFALLAVVFRAVHKRWLVALTGALILTSLALLLLWYLMPPSKYTARALLQFDIVPSNIAESPHQQYYLANLSTLQKTHTALIRSRTVLETALRDPAVQNLDFLRTKSDPVTYLEQNLSADFGISPEIMRVTISGQDANALQTVLRCIVQAYLSEVRRREHAQTRAELDRVRDMIAKHEEKISAKRTRLRELEQAVGSGQAQALEVFLKGYLEQLDRNRRELAIQQHTLRQINAELDILLPKINLARKLAASNKTLSWFLRLPAPQLLAYVVTEAEVERKLQEDNQFLEKRRELQKLEAELEAAHALLSPSLSDEHKATLLKAKRDAVADARIQLYELSCRLRPLIQQQLVMELLIAGEKRLSELMDKRNQAVQLEKFIHEEVISLEKLIASLKRDHIDLQWLKEDLENDQQAVKRLSARKDELEVLCSSATRVKLFEDAVILPAYESKKRWLYVIIAIFASLTSWITGLVTWEWRTQCIHGPEELAGKVQAPIISCLPRVDSFPSLPSHTSGPGVLLPADVARFLESMDALRSLLLHILQRQLAQAILVTSAVQGEGKTSLSCHLAASIARTGRRVLLVDTDLRRSRAHKLLGVGHAPGLAEVLQGHLDWHSVVKCDILPNLDFLPAGQILSVSVGLLGQEYFQKLLEQWRHSYDFIILDSPPVLLVADSLSLAPAVDTVLLSTMYKVSRLPRTQIAYHRLLSLGARILGIVVNGISPRHYEYYYGPYHYYAARPQLIHNTSS